MTADLPPLIRIDLESMQHSLKHAFQLRQEEIAPLIDAAIERAITPENLADIIDRHARNHINNAVEKEIKNFFMYGGGRVAIKAAVQTMLDEKVPA